MSGKLPYRNTNYDALALGEFFYTTSTNTNAYAYWNNYYKNQWYSPAPRTNRMAFSSNVIQTLTANTGLDNHFLQADVKLRDYNTPEQYFSMSIYVSSGSTRFRMDVGSPGQVYCDFNLSSGTVITSVGTIYNRITLIDTALGVYLCQVIGPIKVYKQNLSRLTFNDSLPLYDDYSRTGHLALRTINDAFSQSVTTSNTFVSDLLLGDGLVVDALSDTGSIDYFDAS
jgi:hypothetical protein